MSNPTTPGSGQNQKPANYKDPKETAISAIIFLAGIGIACWLLFGEIWPVPWLNEVQAKIFDGSYYPKLTAAVTIIGVLLPMIGIQKLVMMAMRKK